VRTSDTLRSEASFHSGLGSPECIETEMQLPRGLLLKPQQLAGHKRKTGVAMFCRRTHSLMTVSV